MKVGVSWSPYDSLRDVPLPRRRPTKNPKVYGLDTDFKGVYCLLFILHLRTVIVFDFCSLFLHGILKPYKQFEVGHPQRAGRFFGMQIHMNKTTFKTLPMLRCAILDTYMCFPHRIYMFYILIPSRVSRSGCSTCRPPRQISWSPCQELPALWKVGMTSDFWDHRMGAV